MAGEKFEGTVSSTPIDAKAVKSWTGFTDEPTAASPTGSANAPRGSAATKGSRVNPMSTPEANMNANPDVLQGAPATSTPPVTQGDLRQDPAEVTRQVEDNRVYTPESSSAVSSFGDALTKAMERQAKADREKAEQAAEAAEAAAEEQPETDPEPEYEPEATTTPAPETPKPKVETPALPPMEDTDMQELLSNPNVPKRTKKQFERILKQRNEIAKAKEDIENTSKAKLAEMEAKLAEYESKVQSGGIIPEDVQKELEEGRKYRRIVDLENDPEIKQQFDTKRDEAKNDALDILKQNGANEADIAALEKIGVVNFFSDAKYADTAEDAILSKLPPAQRRLLEKRVADILDIDRQRKRYIETEAAKAKEWYAERRKQQTETQTVSEAQRRADEEALAKGIDLYLDQLKEAEIPAEADEPTRHRLEHVNALTKRARTALKEPRFRSIYEEAVKANTLQGKYQTAIQATMGALLADELKAERAARLKVEAELSQIRRAARPGRSPTGSVPAATAAATQNPLGKSPTEAFIGTGNTWDASSGGFR
jgi:hypothetical protein